MEQLLKIAHRGYSERYPENTMIAFEKAMEAGADMIELDVHLSADKKLVVIHDETIDRTSDGSGRVGHMTVHELQRYNYNCGDAGAGFCALPLLEDVMDLVKGKSLLNIEIKNLPSRYNGIEDALINALRDTDFIENTVVSSFDHFSLMMIKDHEPSLKTGMLYNSLWVNFADEVSALDCYSIHPSVDAFDRDQAAWARDHTICVYPWVARDQATLKRMADSELVDGIMVNDLTLFDML